MQKTAPNPASQALELLAQLERLAQQVGDVEWDAFQLNYLFWTKTMNKLITSPAFKALSVDEKRVLLAQLIQAHDALAALCEQKREAMLQEIAKLRKDHKSVSAYLK
jgi:hypothetical protein